MYYPSKCTTAYNEDWTGLDTQKYLTSDLPHLQTRHLPHVVFPALIGCVIWRVTTTEGRTRGRQHDLEPVMRLAEALSVYKKVKTFFYA